MTHDTCRRCAAAPHPDILTGLHANYVRLADQGLTIPALVTQGEQTWRHVRYAHVERDFVPPQCVPESPHALVAGQWVPRGGILVWQEAS